DKVHALADLVDEIEATAKTKPHLPHHVIRFARVLKAAVPTLHPAATIAEAIAELRQLAVVLKPLPLDDPTLERRRVLLILPGKRPRAHSRLEPGKHFVRETLGPQKLPGFTRMYASLNGKCPALVELGLGWELDMRPRSRLLREHVPGEIHIVEPLHDQDDCSRCGIVQPRAKRSVEVAIRCLALRIAERLLRVHGIVHDQFVASLAGRRPCDRS